MRQEFNKTVIINSLELASFREERRYLHRLFTRHASLLRFSFLAHIPVEYMEQILKSASVVPQARETISMYVIIAIIIHERCYVTG